MSGYSEALNNQCKFQYLQMKVAMDRLKAYKYADMSYAEIRRAAWTPRMTTTAEYIKTSEAFEECMKKAMTSRLEADMKLI